MPGQQTSLPFSPCGKLQLCQAALQLLCSHADSGMHGVHAAADLAEACCVTMTGCVAHIVPSSPQLRNIVGTVRSSRHGGFCAQ